MSPEPTILIVAGVYREAAYYARHHNLHTGEWVWVKNVETLRGRTAEDSRVVFTGSFSERKDATEIVTTVRAYGLPWQHEPELFTVI